MSTKRSQRIAIWVIAGAMLVGTLGSFLVMILAPRNEAADQARMEELSQQYQTEYAAYQEKVDAQAAELSKQYYDTFKQYESRVGTFDDDVTELATEDIVVGDGDALTSESSFTAYYVGWTPDGNKFESSVNGESLSAPISASPQGVIEGWSQGVDGMKVGGVRELTIPSDLAYGEAGSGDAIPGDTPLKFVMMVIPTPEEIPEPQPSAELNQLYQRMYGISL